MWRLPSQSHPHVEAPGRRWARWRRELQVAVPVRMAGVELRWCQRRGLPWMVVRLTSAHPWGLYGTSSAAVGWLVGKHPSVRSRETKLLERRLLELLLLAWVISLERHRNYGRVVVEEADMNP